ncbi:MAG: MmgE/PrpD family protein, partial [Thermocladium sp.]
EFERRIDHPRGHPMNPMTDEEVEAKFRKLTKSLLTEKQQAEVIGLAWKLDELATISKIIKAATI